jgi:3-hydroxy-9,10-secoandrosta-1,3,5(10)-triene-9,17-dione monooxygenase
MTITPDATTIAPPEPGLTPEALVQRAVDLRPKLIDQQAETEARTYHSQELHEDFLNAGFYRTYIPRRFGGYEFDVTTMVRVMFELARGCPSTAWCVGLGSGHALQLASWWGEQAQAEIFGTGDFRAASVAAPIGMATRTDDGWELNGKVSYCSGIPYSTHYMGQALTPGQDGEPGPMMLFFAQRGAWEMQDDWGNTLGLKGSGSHSITFDHGQIPAHWALEDTFMVDVDNSKGTAGLELHGNPLYVGRALGPFTMSLGAAIIGAGFNALDQLEAEMRTKMTPLPPFIPRFHDADFQRYFGGAKARLSMAQAALYRAADMHMEFCHRFVDKGIPFSYGDDQLIGAIAREAYIYAWEAMERDIWRAAGSSASRDGERIQRMFRDMAMIAGHRNTQLRDWAHRELASEAFGIPRDPATGNRQLPKYGA